VGAVGQWGGGDIGSEGQLGPEGRVGCFWPLLVLADGPFLTGGPWLTLSIGGLWYVYFGTLANGRFELYCPCGRILPFLWGVYSPMMWVVPCSFSMRVQPSLVYWLTIFVGVVGSGLRGWLACSTSSSV